jgi:hypothetical protein
VTAASQIAGDQLPCVAETARDYLHREPAAKPVLSKAFIRQSFPASIAGGFRRRTVRLVTVCRDRHQWRSWVNAKRPDRREKERWNMRGIRSHSAVGRLKTYDRELLPYVFDWAKDSRLIARTENLTTSFQDGIDAARRCGYWYDGEIHVKVLPPSRGFLIAS